jgi:hypothetical protein
MHNGRGERVGEGVEALPESGNEVHLRRMSEIELSN